MGYIFENYAKGAGGALNNHVDQILTNFDPLEWTSMDISNIPPLVHVDKRWTEAAPPTLPKISKYISF